MLMKFQMFRLNKIKYLLFLVLLFIVFSLDCFALVNPTSDFYVNDYANILSDEVEKYIIDKSKVLDNTDGTQIVVVTVPNLEGMSIEDYALQLFRNFGIGDKSKNNGLLLLLALEEREFRVEVGYGLEGILPDGKTGRFQDEYIIPYLRQDNWNDGIKNGYDAFYKEIIVLNNLELDYSEPNNLDDINPIYITISVLIAAVFGLITRFSKNNSIKKYGTILYIVLWFIALQIAISAFVVLIVLLIYNMFFYVCFRFGSLNQTGGGNYRSSSRGGSSRSSFGRGGSSGGGGSSRRF